MLKHLSFFLAAVILCGVVATAQADTIIAATGANSTDGYDNNWRAAFLGQFEMGVGDKTHNGTHIGEKFKNSGTDYSKKVTYSAGDTFLVGHLVSAYEAAKIGETLNQAFVYDNSQWPLGENDNPWANLAHDHPGTNWIGSKTGQYNSGVDNLTSHLAGYYAYETTFTTDENYSYLTGSIATDNKLLAVLVNGELLDTWSFVDDAGEESVSYDGINGIFTIDASWADPGENTITFILNNHNSQVDNYGNPNGLWVGKLSLTNHNRGTTPEPGTMLIFGLASLVGVPVYRRWKQNNQ